MSSSRAWHLASRPTGMAEAANFEMQTIESPALADGMVRVRNRWLSVDPYMRGRMNAGKSYIPPFQLGAPLEGGAIGEVVESRSPDLKPGDRVMHMLGWREEAAGPAGLFTRLPDMDVAEEEWLATLGGTGATAYFGLLDVAEAKEGDVVFISAAAGAVGSAAVQIAKVKGMTVIGSARGPEKCQWVRSLGADAVIDYKAGPIAEALAAAAPDGIDVYFDNVGGDHLDAALGAARNNARFAVCGMIESYNDAKPSCFANAMRIVAARINLRGFLLFDFLAEMDRFHRDMGGWLSAGQIISKQTVHDGIEAAPRAFLDLFSGGNLGKMLVRL